MASQLTLLSEITIGKSIRLANRVALAPLTRGRCGPTQVPGEVNAQYYTQRANAGLIISEGTIISQEGMGWAGAAAIYSDEHVKGWQQVTSKVHEHGSKIFCQLWHMGRTSGSVFHGVTPVAPSAIATEGRVTDYEGNKHAYETPRALEISEIPRLINDYRVAARNAKEAGFDGVEVHCANGYLLDTFLQSSTNKRDDAYGGSVENRFRLISEVILACQESFPNGVAVRISPNGVFGGMGSEDNFDAYTYYVTQLNQHNLAYLHVMDGLGFGFHNKCAQMKLADVRKVYDGVIMGNVGYEKLTAEGAINTGATDLIAFGRPFISNPDLVTRFANGWPLAPPADHTCFYNFPAGQPEVGYTDFPAYSDHK